MPSEYTLQLLSREISKIQRQIETEPPSPKTNILVMELSKLRCEWNELYPQIHPRPWADYAGEQ